MSPLLIAVIVVVGFTLFLAGWRAYKRIRRPPVRVYLPWRSHGEFFLRATGHLLPSTENRPGSLFVHIKEIETKGKYSSVKEGKSYWFSAENVRRL